MSNEDTNINNYDNDELLDIIGLNENSTLTSIENKINSLINSYTLENNNKYVGFFINVKNKLLNSNDYNDKEGFDNQEDDNQEDDNQEDDNQEKSSPMWSNVIDSKDNMNTITSTGVAKNTITDQNNKITDRSQISSFNTGSTTVLNQPQRGVNNNIPLSIAQDTLNPTLRQTVTRYITIDSQYRNNLYPYSFNPNNTKGTDTNFTCTLSEPLQNVLSLKLESLYLPNTWYTFDDYIGNTDFCIYYADSSSNFRNDIGVNRYKVKIEPGTYDTVELLSNQINTAIQYCVSDVSRNSNGELILGPDNFPIINYDLSGLRCVVNNKSSTNKKIGFLNYTDYFIKIIFYPEPLLLSGQTINGCINNKNPCASFRSYTNNLGYYLGYKILDESTSSEENLEIKLSPLNLILDSSQNVSDAWATALTNEYYIALTANDDVSLNIITIKTIEALVLANTTQALGAPNWPGSYTNTSSGQILTGFATSQALLNSSQYFQFILDDFNQSFATGSSIGIAKENTRLDIPGYFSKIPQDSSGLDISSNVSLMCTDTVSNNSRYFPTLPRRVTQAQLYALNEIIANRKLADNKPSTPNFSNLFATIYTPQVGIDESKNIINNNNNIINERKYFGPITLEKLGIRLIDSKGITLNLHGHNWSFTLAVEILYQY